MYYALQLQLYMSETYGFNLSNQDRQLYSAWNNSDPPDSWEILRNERIKGIQDVGNSYIENYQQLDAAEALKRYREAQRQR